MWPKIQDMAIAPRDRKILIKLKDGTYHEDDFIVAKYEQWDLHKSNSQYHHVWEMAPGECYVLGDTNLAGWWDLPKE